MTIRPKHVAFVTSLGGFQVTSQFEPASIIEALSLFEWLEYMTQHIEVLLKNGIWELVECPDGTKSISYKWVLRVKLKADEVINKQKTIFVDKGFNQVEGVDYKETFSHFLKP